MPHLFTDQQFQNHETGAGHPESSLRLSSITARLASSDILASYESGQVREATIEELSRVHQLEHIRYVEELSQQGGGQIGGDTVLSEESYRVALLAAGTAIEAVDQVILHEAGCAVSLARPPGHHALADEAMGFCLFNNAAVAAQHAVEMHGLQRVLIIDWDVHHGNGTQALFYDDPIVHFFSSHRTPFYPHTGLADETGTGAGLGTTTNLPLKFGISRNEFFSKFQGKLFQAAEKCRPELVLISAGFDAHREDPVGSLGLESEDFFRLTEIVQEVANVHAGGRIVSLLEGGYHVDRLAESVEYHLRGLLQK